MPKIKSSPKHNPGKFRTHLAQAVKHLELAQAEHAKLFESQLTSDQREDWEAIASDITDAAKCANLSYTQFIECLRPTLPGYVEVTERDEEDGE